MSSGNGLLAKLVSSTGEYTKSLIAITSLTVVAMIAGIVAWKSWGAQVTQTDAYQLTMSRVEINDPPPYIHADIKQSVFRQAGLEKLSVLDRQAISKVKQAFELNPWVESVSYARKRLPSGLELKLKYRQPVAMVEVESGLMPVDRQGVVLDPRDFSERMALKFIRVLVDYRSPSGVLGHPWGDVRVEQGAAIAGALQDMKWREMGIYRIVALPGEKAPTFELRTEDNVKIIWGKSPGLEKPGEVSATDKLEWMEAYVKLKGPFNKLEKNAVIDLRDKSPANEG